MQAMAEKPSALMMRRRAEHRQHAGMAEPDLRKPWARSSQPDLPGQRSGPASATSRSTASSIPSSTSSLLSTWL